MLDHDYLAMVEHDEVNQFARVGAQGLEGRPGDVLDVQLLEERGREREHAHTDPVAIAVGRRQSLQDMQALFEGAEDDVRVRSSGRSQGPGPMTE